MVAVRTIGIVIMFLGLALKLADMPGYTPAFITGAVLIIFARLYPKRRAPRDNF